MAGRDPIEYHSALVAVRRSQLSTAQWYKFLRCSLIVPEQNPQLRWAQKPAI